MNKKILSLGLLIICGLIFSLISLNQHRESLIKFHKKSDQRIVIPEKIQYYDEVLTMSAYMAVLKHDIKWIERYNNAVSPLENILLQARKIFPEIIVHLDKIEVENEILISLESQSFKLLRQNRFDEAQNILFSEKYAKSKKEYNKYLQSIINTIESSIDRLEKESENKFEYLLVLIIIIMLLITFVIIWVYTIFNKQTKEIKTSKESLENQLSITNTIIDSVPIRIFWKDKDGVYLGANQLFIDDAELNTSADIIGKTDFEQTWRESAQQFIEDDAGVVNSGVARLNYEEVQPKEDGSSIYIRTSKVPLVDIDNNTLGILGIYDDITEAKEMEIDLQEAKDISEKANKELTRHLELFSNNVIASSSDLKGNIIYATKALSEISGYSNKELIGQPHSILKSHSTSKKVFKDLWNTIQSGKTWIGELKNATKDGSFYWVEATISPDYDDNGSIIGYSSVRQDITAEKAKEMFLANMSHEIRTPMNSIIGFIELIKNDSKEETISKYANIAYISSQGLLKIIDDILDISKIESGKIDIEIITFDTRDELESIGSLFDYKASEKNITLNITTEQAFPKYLKTDPYRIRQVVSNLLSNAIKFTESGKNVDMHISYKDKALCISVKDEGKGIAEDKIDHIFEAFNQEDVSTTREYGGTGLGLSISYELVHLLGGKLQVKSELGVGSEFFLCIPAEEGEAIVKATTQQAISNRSKSIKVLLVEDNKSNQLFMKVILKKLNIEFEIAENGLEAFEKFKTNKYDLLLMDENMPIMGGIESTKNILEYEKANDLVHTPIVALTANAIKGDRERFLAAGMDEYLTKPVTKDTLEKVLSIIDSENP